MDNYNRELARSINQMFAQNRTDPNAVEIADFHFGGKALGGEIIDGIRKRLPKIAQIMELDYERRVCVVSEKYYTLFRDSFLPTTEEDAYKCLPIGAAVRPMGIRLAPHSADLIYETAINQDVALGLKSFRQSQQRLREAANRPIVATLKASLKEMGVIETDAKLQRSRRSHQRKRGKTGDSVSGGDGS